MMPKTPARAGWIKRGAYSNSPGYRRTRDRKPARMRENLGAASGSSSALPNAFRMNTNKTRANPTPIVVYTAICARLGLDFLSGGVAGSTT
jgi:hypothetical protein